MVDFFQVDDIKIGFERNLRETDVYGVCAILYAFHVGIITKYKFPRYLNHSAIEFLVINLLLVPGDGR